eukprot:scaffold96601_cov23-Cyclotella_meneghiniana.AAC.2
MDYLSKKDTRSGIPPYPNYGAQVPNVSLIRADSNGEYALNLPIVEGTVVGYSPPLNESSYSTENENNNNGDYFEFELD